MADSIMRVGTTPKYSEAVVHGGVVYLAGQVPEDGSAPIEAQCISVFKQIDALLANCRSSKSRILSAQVFLTSSASVAAMNEQWIKWMPSGCAPARATVVNVALVDPSWLIEVCVTAAVDASA